MQAKFYCIIDKEAGMTPALGVDIDKENFFHKGKLNEETRPWQKY